MSRGALGVLVGLPTSAGAPLAFMHRLDTRYGDQSALGNQFLAQLLRLGHQVRPAVPAGQQGRGRVQREVAWD